ncbi:hypothetical protein BGLA2_860013 [Burkholderia gladioli]|nr:hypothetical protein BGLA2_860013 [Burkholderia gladioli]
MACFYRLRLAHAGLYLFLRALEQGPKGLEVLAGLAIRNLISRTLFGAGANMAQDCDVVRVRNIC